MTSFTHTQRDLSDSIPYGGMQFSALMRGCGMGVRVWNFPQFKGPSFVYFPWELLIFEKKWMGDRPEGQWGWEEGCYRELWLECT